MEIKFKHLAFYLPYELKVLSGDAKEIYTLIGIENNYGEMSYSRTIQISGEDNLRRYQQNIKYCKPILIPKKELNRYAKFNVDKAYSFDFINFRNELLSFLDNDLETFDWFITMIINNEPINDDFTVNKIIEINQIFAKFKIDIFDLIPNKLAVAGCL